MLNKNVWKIDIIPANTVKKNSYPNEGEFKSFVLQVVELQVIDYINLQKFKKTNKRCRNILIQIKKQV